MSWAAPGLDASVSCHLGLQAALPAGSHRAGEESLDRVFSVNAQLLLQLMYESSLTRSKTQRAGGSGVLQLPMA